MEKLYIKFEQGNKESLDTACEEAERLGYEKKYHSSSISFEGYGLLDLDRKGDYYISKNNEQRLISFGYKEHKIEGKDPVRSITYKGVSFSGDSIEDIKKQIEKKLSDNKSERRLLKEFRKSI